MPKAFVPKIVSANDLLTGDVVYLTGAGGFSRDIDEAVIANDEDSAKGLLDWAAGQPGRAVGAYLVEVDAPPGATPRPLHHREIIRDHGPTHIAAFDRKREHRHVSLRRV